MSIDIEKIKEAIETFSLDNKDSTELEIVGSKDLEIELSDEEIQRIIELYLEENLSPESFSIFTDMMAKNISVPECVYHAVFNEGVIECLNHFIDKNTNPVTES